MAIYLEVTEEMFHLPLGHSHRLHLSTVVSTMDHHLFPTPAAPKKKKTFSRGLGWLIFIRVVLVIQAVLDIELQEYQLHMQVSIQTNSTFASL